MSLDGGLSAECADVFGMLSDFHLLDLLSEGGTVSEWREKNCQRSASILIPSPRQSNARRGGIDICRRGEVRISKCVLQAARKGNPARPSRFVTYLVPYFPVTPTFLVLFVILAEVAVMNGFGVGLSLKMI